MRLRLAAEDAVESVWAAWPVYEEKMAAIADGHKIYLQENVPASDNELEIRTYVLRRQDRFYLIACAFRRADAWDAAVEPHIFAKGVIQKVKTDDKEYYKWLGWTD